MKRCIALLLVLFTLVLMGCGAETVPKEKSLEVLSPLKGSTLEKTHKIEDFEPIIQVNTI